MKRFCNLVGVAKILGFNDFIMANYALHYLVLRKVFCLVVIHVGEFQL
jgi:hypothetical protein